jgi:ketosteroid isomerase-like protein
MMIQIEHAPIHGTENILELPPHLQALSGFYAAFNQRDLDKMAQIWTHTDEAVIINPFSITRGWEEIRLGYTRMFSGSGFVQAEFYNYSVHADGEFFYAVGRERGEFRQEGTRIALVTRTTNIFKLIGGRWLLVHHHTSMDDPKTLADYRQAIGIR